MARFDIMKFPPLDYQAKEAINTLCANLSFAGGDIKAIMVTSSHPQEGKSFISMNLMRGFAELGLRVVLVDLDIRASALQSRYGIKLSSEEPYSGLVDYLAGRCDMDSILAQTSIPNASIILSKRNVANSLPLLSSPRLAQLMQSLKESFDIVIVDAPPVGTIIDAAKIAVQCDGTLFVIQSGSVHQQQLTDALSQIEKTGCPLLGTVLNKVEISEFQRKYYYSGYGDYGYYYHRSSGSKSSDGKSKKKTSGKHSEKSHKAHT